MLYSRTLMIFMSNNMPWHAINWVVNTKRGRKQEEDTSTHFKGRSISEGGGGTQLTNSPGTWGGGGGGGGGGRGGEEVGGLRACCLQKMHTELQYRIFSQIFSERFLTGEFLLHKTCATSPATLSFQL